MKDQVATLTAGLMVVYVGAIYLLYTLGLISSHLNVWWPGLLILLGVGMILKFWR